MFSFFEKMSKSKRLAGIFFLVTSIFFTLEYSIVGMFSYVRVGDNLDTFVPRLSTIGNVFSNTHISYWYPYLAGGVDRLANDISFLRVDGLFSSIFSDWATYVVILVVSLFLGGYYIFFIANRILKYRVEAAIIAGVFFMYAMLFENIIPFLLGFGIFPFLIYQCEIWRLQLQEKRPLKSVLTIVGIGLVFGLFSSFVFSLPFTIAGLLIWFFFFRQERNIIFWVGMAGVIFLAISLHIQEFYSLVLHVSVSNRSGGYFDGGIAGYISYLRYILGLYGLPLICFVSGAMIFKIKDRFMLWTIGLISASIFLIPAYQMAVPLIGGSFGFLSDFDMRRFFLLFPFLFGLGFAHLINESSGSVTLSSRNTTYQISLILTGLCFVLILGFHITTKVGHVYEWLTRGGFYANTYSDGLEILAKKTRHDPPFRVGTITSGKVTLVPTVPHFFRMETVDGHANLTSRRYGEFFRLLAYDQTIKSSFYLFHQASEDEKIRFSNDSSEFINKNLLSLANVRFLVSTIPIVLDNFVLLAGQKEIVFENQESNFFERQRARVHSILYGRDLLIYENDAVFPRSFVTGRVQIEKDSTDILNVLENASINDLRSNAILNLGDLGENLEKYSVFDDGSDLGGSVIITTFDPDEIVVKVSIATPSFLVLTNTYDPFWNAYIDDQQVSIVPAYHAFMGIPLFESGEHDVVFKYEPPYSIFSN